MTDEPLPKLKDEVRLLPPEVMFMPQWVQTSLNHQLARINEVDHGMIIDVAVDGDQTVRSMLVFKVNDQASISGWLDKPKQGRISYGAEITATF